MITVFPGMYDACGGESQIVQAEWKPARSRIVSRGGFAKPGSFN